MGPITPSPTPITLQSTFLAFILKQSSPPAHCLLPANDRVRHGQPEIWEYGLPPLPPFHPVEGLVGDEVTEEVEHLASPRQLAPDTQDVDAELNLIMPGPSGVTREWGVLLTWKKKSV